MTHVDVSGMLWSRDRHDHLLRSATKILRFKSLYKILSANAMGMDLYRYVPNNEGAIVAYCAARLMYPRDIWYLHNERGNIVASTEPYPMEFLGIEVDDCLMAFVGYQQPDVSCPDSTNRIGTAGEVMDILIRNYRDILNVNDIFYDREEDVNIEGTVIYRLNGRYGSGISIRPHAQPGYTIDHINLLLGEYVYDDDVMDIVYKMLDTNVDMTRLVLKLKSKVDLSRWMWRALIISIYSHRVHGVLLELFQTYGMTELDARSPGLLPRMNKYQTGDIDFIFQ